MVKFNAYEGNFKMRAMIGAVILPLLAAGCGDTVDNSVCDLTSLTVKVDTWPNEQARAKAKEHLAQAKDAQAKKDAAACETHKKEAEAALIL